MTDTESEPGYADAISELDAILADLEADDIDIDVLATKVERAAELAAGGGLERDFAERDVLNDWVRKFEDKYPEVGIVLDGTYDGPP